MCTLRLFSLNQPIAGGGCAESADCASPFACSTVDNTCGKDLMSARNRDVSQCLIFTVL